MKKNKYKFKKWVLIPIFLLMCSLILGFSCSKPANALVVGESNNNSNLWYSTLPSDVVVSITDVVSSELEFLNGVSYFYSFPNFFPSDFVETDSTFDPITIQNTITYGNQSIVSTNLFFQDNLSVSYLNSNYDYYEQLMAITGGGNYGFVAMPMNIEIKYKNFVLPFGNQLTEDNVFVRNEKQLNLMSSDFYNNSMNIYLYKYSGAVSRINSVDIEFARLPSSNGSNISSLTYTWTYDVNNNTYYDESTGILENIQTENTQYYMLDLKFLILKTINDIYNNSPLLGQDLIYIKNLSVNCYTEASTLTSDYIFAVSGNSINSVDNDFYDSDNNPFSGFYISDLDWFNSHNLVVPYFEPVEPVDMSSWLINSVGAFMNAELFPGFAIGGIIAVIIAFPLAIWLLKVALGG